MPPRLGDSAGPAAASLLMTLALAVVMAARPAGWASAAPRAVCAPDNEAAARTALAKGENPCPVRLVRPPSGPLSTMARLGEAIFHDPSLSASGRLACASCHDPAHHYGPPDDRPVQIGGPDMKAEGARAVPSLVYLEREPPFSVGPDKDEADLDQTASLSQMVALARGAPRAVKTAATTAASAANLVPQGGLFWDGRVDTLQQQAIQPLLNPVEMANPSVAAVAARLRRASYAPLFTLLFGPGILDNPAHLVSEAMFAVGRYQIEDPSFHPYTSKFDAWLEGRARFTPAELRGYVLFNDPDRADCAGCHVDQVGRDGLPPRFTDDQFEALGVPRNRALAIDKDPRFHDLGICGPFRTDMRDQTRYCGMFLTPTLRDVATRRSFFHNGVYHTLREVMDFYDFRDVAPEKIYPRGPGGRVEKFDDIPPRFRANVDVVDPPLDRHLGEAPAMTRQDEDDIIAFMRTLTDGYRPRTFEPRPAP
jgi:cytochrome c peroxidase